MLSDRLLIAAAGGMWISQAGDLKANHIFHLNSRSALGWSKLIKTCLKNCEKSQARSIAFPALGTGTQINIHVLFLMCFVL